MHVPPRTPRALHVSEELRRLLTGFRAREYARLERTQRDDPDDADTHESADLHGPACIELDELLRIEEELGTALPDDVLAVFAARLPALRKWRSFGFDQVAANTQRAWNDHGMARRLIALAVRPEPGDRTTFIAMDRTVPGDPVELEMLTYLGTERMAADKVTLFYWVRDVFTYFHGEAAIVDALSSSGHGSFKPMLVGPARPTARVHHDRFGDGDVMADRGDKIEVEFAEFGRKVLLRQAVRFLNPD
ncbi:MAG: hypothetical protein ACOYOB_06600 [Myxococcota bacterium]